MSTADNSSTATNATDNGINTLVHTSGNNNPIFNSTRPTTTTAPPPPNRPLELEGSMVIVDVESALDRYNAAVEAGLVARPSPRLVHYISSRDTTTSPPPLPIRPRLETVEEEVTNPEERKKTREYLEKRLKEIVKKRKREEEEKKEKGKG